MQYSSRLQKDLQQRQTANESSIPMISAVQTNTILPVVDVEDMLHRADEEARLLSEAAVTLRLVEPMSHLDPPSVLRPRLAMIPTSLSTPIRLFDLRPM
jgi:hypothetical protein